MSAGIAMPPVAAMPGKAAGELAHDEIALDL